MPKDDKRKELTQEEIDAQNEKFRTFFSTSVAQVPEEMKRRDEEKENTGSLLGKLFHREKDKEEPAAAPASGQTYKNGAKFRVCFCVVTKCFSIENTISYICKNFLPIRIFSAVKFVQHFLLHLHLPQM